MTTSKEEHGFSVVWVTKQAGANALASLEKLYLDARQEQLAAGESSGTATSWPLFVTEDREAANQVQEISPTAWPRAAILPFLRYLAGRSIKGEKVGPTNSSLNKYEPGTTIRVDNDWEDAIRFTLAVPHRRAALIRAVVNTNWMNRRLLQAQTEPASRLIGQYIAGWIAAVERALNPYEQGADKGEATLLLKNSDGSEVVVERNSTQDKLQDLKEHQLYLRFQLDKTPYVIF
ncbi:hypothetical protein ACVWWG_007981 [Bradyrhizobium sp. LB7.2]